MASRVRNFSKLEVQDGGEAQRAPLQTPESAEAAGDKGSSADEAMQRLAAGLPCGLGAPSLGVAQTLLEQVIFLRAQHSHDCLLLRSPADPLLFLYSQSLMF